MKTLSTFTPAAIVSFIAFILSIMVCAILNERGIAVNGLNVAGLIAAASVFAFAVISFVSEIKNVKISPVQYAYSHGVKVVIGSLSFSLLLPIIK
jgi:hypothetical protein